MLLLGVVIGAMLQFSDGFMFMFNLLLSMLAIFISGIILVSGARSEAALQVKLNYRKWLKKSRSSSTSVRGEGGRALRGEAFSVIAVCTIAFVRFSQVGRLFRPKCREPGSDLPKPDELAEDIIQILEAGLARVPRRPRQAEPVATGAPKVEPL